MRLLSRHEAACLSYLHVFLVLPEPAAGGPRGHSLPCPASLFLIGGDTMVCFLGILSCLRLGPC